MNTDSRRKCRRAKCPGIGGREVGVLQVEGHADSHIRIFSDQLNNRLTVVLCRKPLQRGLIGMVRGNVIGSDIPIVMGMTSPEQMEYEHAALFSLGTGMGVIQMTPGVIKGIRSGDPFSRTCLFHELGHFLRHHLEVPGFQNGEYDAERYRVASEGGILLQEVEADAVSAEYLGADTTIAGLKMIRDLNARKLGDPRYDQESARVSVLELDNRIKTLSKRQ